MKLFPNFTSIPFDYLLISWVTNYVSNLGFLTCLYWIISIDKIPVRILLDVLFGVFRFSKASICALTSSFTAFKNFVATLTLKSMEGARVE